MEFMFDECIKLKEIKGINKFNTINVTSMYSMFQDCNQLEYLDLSGFNTSNVTNMGKMFKKCYKLKQIKGINNFNISKVTNKDEMFDECNELEYLILSKFNIKDDINNHYNEKLKNELNEERKKNIELMNILNLQNKIPNVLPSVSEKVFAVNFRTIDQSIIYPVVCKSSDSFSSVEMQLYQEYPELRTKKDIAFIANGNVINRAITVGQNKIKRGDTILIQYS